MKIRLFTPIIAIAALNVAFLAQAHDPKEHMKDAKNPNCAAMQDMDHSKMDMQDPVMQAMMKQCAPNMHHEESENDEAQADHNDDKKISDEKHSEHKH